MPSRKTVSILQWIFNVPFEVNKFSTKYIDLKCLFIKYILL